MDEITEIAEDGIIEGARIVDETFTKGFDGIRLAYLGLGIAVGGALGAFIGYKMAYTKAELKFSEIAAEEIAEMRQHYKEKAVAADLSVKKAELTDIVRDRGYSEEKSTKPPMAVTPPEAVVEAAKEAADETEDVNNDVIVKPPTPEPEIRNIFREAEVEDEWDWHAERRKRTPRRPYIIHVDERDEQQAYDGVTFTYYEADDVLCNERDEVVAKEDRDKLIGEAHLDQFGHGSNDASIVYIRNDQLEMDFEVVRSPNSYAEEVHGFDPPEIRHAYRHGRRSFDDE